MIKSRRTATSRNSSPIPHCCNLTISLSFTIFTCVLIIISYLSSFLITGDHFLLIAIGNDYNSSFPLPESHDQLIRPIVDVESLHHNQLQIKQQNHDEDKPARHKSSIFNQRVSKFLNNKACKSQFFMISISDSSLFGERECLAVETLFKAHPDACLVILSDTLETRSGKKLLNPITKLGFRILVINPDYNSLFTNTPALQWYTDVKLGRIDPGTIPLSQNLSNLLRLAALYKYGGVYLDTDFIVMRKFSELKNSIAAQSMDAGTKHWTRLNNAVLIFDKGHPVLLMFIEEFAASFDGSKWGHNGPYLVSRVIDREEESRRLGGAGYDVTVLPPMAFYPVDWIKIPGLFSKPESVGHNKWIQKKLAQIRSESYGVHLWNRQTRGLEIEEGSVIRKLVSERCIICEGISAAS